MEAVMCAPGNVRDFIYVNCYVHVPLGNIQNCECHYVSFFLYWMFNGLRFQPLYQTIASNNTS